MSDATRPIGPASDAEHPGTSEVTATVIVKAAADRVFTALTAWERQSEWIPFTVVKITKGDGGVGSTVEAVTTVGPAVLTDIMRVEAIDRPYQVKVMHTRQDPARTRRDAVHGDGSGPHAGGLA